MASALTALDRVRGTVLTAVARSPLLPLVAKRDARARTRAVLAITLAFGVTVICPAAALAVSPLVLGVPHVAASVRYLVLRQGLSRRMIVATACICTAMAAARILEQYGQAPIRYARFDIGLAAVWAILAAFAAARPTRAWKRAATVAVIVMLAGPIALLHPRAARLLFVHVHNLGAVLLWVAAFRRGRFPTVTVGLLFLGLALLLTGFTLPLTEGFGGLASWGVSLRAVGAWLAPGFPLKLSLPLVLVHVFTDSVHYAFWLGVIPDETLRHEGTLSFNMTLRGLVRDFGVVGLAAVVGLTLAFGVGGLMSAEVARSAYFAVAGFHGYVEGVMLVYVMVRGRRD